MVYQSQPQCSTHFRIIKRASFILIKLNATSFFSLYMHPPKNESYSDILGRNKERLKWTCQLTRLKGIAATTDALLLLFQIRFTKHGLWHHTVWTADCFKCYFISLLCAVVTALFYPKLFIVLSYDIPETVSKVNKRTRTSAVQSQLKVQNWTQRWL